MLSQGKKPSETTVVVGMSGGVDSSVAALLLKEQGYRVIGVFMKNWDEKDESGACTAAKDYEDVARVCDRLGVPHYSVEFVKEYWDHVFTSFLEEYKAGFTPNPDILCNREIKFKLFLKKALELDADFLATGHYCRTNPERELLKGVDPGKDQSYFVYTLTRETLGKVLFPIGHLLKSDLRELARKAGLSTSEKKDSTGICFIGERDFKKFLGQYVAAQPGKFRTLDGKVVGEHTGAAYYTLGQRRGLGLGGEGARWFVVAKDIERNTVFVERGETHPALFADYLTATEPSWVAGAPPAAEFRARAKIRYRQADQDCRVGVGPDGRLRVDFDQPQRAITPRQSVVFYDGERCLGGAMIERGGPTYYEQKRELPTGGDR
ncbi:MAG: tRNA 2-thiouridine(34) synthase MnmA [Deltaproteobacteria bacterium]|nr:tRNA 2-thiouridine(34) synthase MnmA [Deltaproteobacteria bacterium]